MFTFQARLEEGATSPSLLCLRGLEVRSTPCSALFALHRSLETSLGANKLLHLSVQVVTSRWDRRECTVSLRILAPPNFAVGGAAETAEAKTAAAAATASSVAASSIAGRFPPPTSPMRSATASNADAWAGVGWTHLDAAAFPFVHSRSQNKLVGAVAVGASDLLCSAFQLVITVRAYNVGLHGLRLVCGDVTAAEHTCLLAGRPVVHAHQRATEAAAEEPTGAQCAAAVASCATLRRSDSSTGDGWAFDGTWSRGGALAAGPILSASGGAFGALCGPLIKVPC